MASFKNGKVDGKLTSWYNNGQKEFEGMYEEGKQDGKWIWWNKVGVKEREAHFINGQPYF